MPLMAPKPPPGSVERTPSPGAKRSTLVAPTFENDAARVVGRVAPTQIRLASGYAHG